MLIFEPITKENIDSAISLANLVFPDDAKSLDGPEKAYRASLEPENHKDFWKKYNLSSLEYFVVREEKEKNISGVTGWYTKSTDPVGTVWLGWYCVHPQQRGKGIGTKILEWTMGQVKEKGYKRMKLYSSTDPNEANAQILYERLGFDLVGEEINPESKYKILFREKEL